MVESPSSHRTVYNGSAMSIPYTKSINDFTWCYESSNLNSISTRTSVDECLPQLEIDDKPLIYRQQFESTVCKQSFSNYDDKFFFTRNILIGMARVKVKDTLLFHINILLIRINNDL